MNFKDRKEGTIRKDYDKNNGKNGLTTGVDDEDGEEYEPIKENNIIYDE